MLLKNYSNTEEIPSLWIWIKSKNFGYPKANLVCVILLFAFTFME
jgi:hypothetical protein